MCLCRKESGKGEEGSRDTVVDSFVVGASSFHRNFRFYEISIKREKGIISLFTMPTYETYTMPQLLGFQKGLC